MEILRSPGMVREALLPQIMRGRRVGLVPTMGALHEGHMSLVRNSTMECDITLVSIFVNPTQFAPDEDMDKYPSDPDGDISKLREAGVDILFMPTSDTMYGKGHESFVDVGPIAAKLCGAFRPTHFRGVATIAAKLFNIVSPTRAYFGQKDYQQCQVLMNMVRDLNIPVDIVVCPTVREPDGLAMSSRNAYLSPIERKAAPILYKALSEASELLRQGGATPKDAKKKMEEMLGAEPHVSEVQYIGCYDPETLDWLEEFKARALLAGAIIIGSTTTTRLIDNVLVYP